MTPEEIDSLVDAAGHAVTAKAHEIFYDIPENPPYKAGMPGPRSLMEMNHEQVVEQITGIIREMITTHADKMSPDHNVNIKAVRLCAGNIYEKGTTRFPNLIIEPSEVEKMFVKNLRKSGHKIPHQNLLTRFMGNHEGRA